jgi:D-aminopeptidase
MTDPFRGPRARDLGITIGLLEPGPTNTITDVDGVRVGHATLVRGEGELRVGHGPVRTGVTVVVPHDGDPFGEAVFAGAHRLNGNGELTGLRVGPGVGTPDLADRDHEHELGRGRA